MNNLNVADSAISVGPLRTGAMGGGLGDFGDYVPNSYLSYSINSNLLYLQITKLSVGTVFANLYNATNHVYAICSSTNLALPFALWQVETEVFPTDTNCASFDVPTQNRQNLFLRAADCTGVTKNGNQTPEWWFWYYYGSAGLNLSDTNLDSQGCTAADCSVE